MNVRLVTALIIILLSYLQGMQLNAQKPELVVQTGHSSFISAVAFSPDGKILASSGLDGVIKLWDLLTGTELRSRQSPPSTSIAFSPDGKILASGHLTGAIELWDVTTGTKSRTLNGHSDVVTSVVFSADGKSLASGSWDRSVKVWDVSSGTELHTLWAHSDRVYSVAINPNNKTLVSCSRDKTIKLWDVSTGGELLTLNGHLSGVTSAAWSPDGKTLVSGSSDRTTRFWDVLTGAELRAFRGHKGDVNSVAFAPDGKILATASDDFTIKLWDVSSGAELRTIRGRSLGASVAFNPDGKTIASGSFDFSVKLWDVSTGSELRSFKGRSSTVSSLALSADGHTLACGSWDNTIKIWDVPSGKLLRTLRGHSGLVNSVAISTDGKHLVSGGGDASVKLWDLPTGALLRTFKGHSESINAVTFSADRKTVASGSSDRTIKMWNVETGSELRTLRGHSDLVVSVTFTSDGKSLASGSNDRTVKLWDVFSGTELRSFEGHSDFVNAVAFSPDGKTLASGSKDKNIKLWDVGTGTQLRTLTGHTFVVKSLVFSGDGKTLASGGLDHSVRLWDVVTGKELRIFTGHTAWVVSVAFSADNRHLVSGSWDTTIKYWELSSGKEVVSLIALDDDEWAVIDPSGRFDASSGAQKLMHWRIGKNLYDIIAFDQLKERYYEPGLLSKLLGFNKEPLRDVSRFESPKLHPVVRYDANSKDKRSLTVTLTNRGGGIGRVQVFVNGKEFLSDARDEKLKKNPNVPQATITIDLSKANSIIAGKDNEIRLVAWNVENYISSRGTSLAWRPVGAANIAAPEVYAIVAGISQYAGSHLNLNFAAKDAVDMANAIELGAKRLFGADKVHLTLLSTAEDPRSIQPSKENFAKAFGEVRQQAKPTDILIVYLAGHGITLQRGSDTYCYLTQEARTTDTAILSDSEIRRQTTITSEELVDWIKQIPALKQVVMLDTCAAGAAQAQLKLVDKREASGDAIRAIDRAKDRTGSYILMGSAADAVSYEASRYGQGLLTYALLKGMKGPALRNDEFVDVSKLFQFAREEVEQLARDIGGIQRPLIFAPRDDSFEVGQLTSEDRVKIALASPRPMILRPRFFDEAADDDTLDLMKLVRSLLRDESFISGRGEKALLVFVDDEEFPGGIRPTGRYAIDGNTVSLTLRLRRDGKEIATAEVTGSKDDVAGLAAKVVQAVKSVIGGLEG